MKPDQIRETPFVFKANESLSPGGNNKFAVGVYNRKMKAGIWKTVHIVSTEAELSGEAVIDLVHR